MLQKANQLNEIKQGSAIYISLDHPFFFQDALIDFVDFLIKEGVETIFLDEVHKYPAKSASHDWSLEIKNIYDLYPEIKLVFSGSSILKLYKGQGDLSRRTSKYYLPGLSFRESLVFNNSFKGEPYNLSEILQNHVEISNQIIKEIKPLPAFRKYLDYGYYPFYNEAPDQYANRINSVISVILETDIPAITEISFDTISKIKRLLILLAGSVPYTPKLSQLRNDLRITDQRTLLKYMNYLDKADLISLISRDSYGNQLLRKPDKIYLNNTNLMASLNSTPNVGTSRETFFYSQLSVDHEISYPAVGDFLVNNKFTFEVGGKNKTTQQIQEVKNAFLALDQIEVGFQRTIPLWLFGFLY
jgi:predicted AAA+ superfamily ATPase